MKKVLILLILAVAAWSLWFINHRDSTKGTVVNLNPVTTAHPDPSNASFSIDDEKVTLRGGHAETADLTDIIGYGDLNGDGKEDAAFLLAVPNPISGAESIYLAGYISGPIDYVSTNTVPLGIQITPKSISIKNGVITVTYLDRKEGEPLSAEPTVLTSRTFRYSTVTKDIE